MITTYLPTIMLPVVFQAAGIFVTPLLFSGEVTHRKTRRIFLQFFRCFVGAKRKVNLFFFRLKMLHKKWSKKTFKRSTGSDFFFDIFG